MDFDETKKNTSLSINKTSIYIWSQVDRKVWYDVRNGQYEQIRAQVVAQITSRVFVKNDLWPLRRAK